MRLRWKVKEVNAGRVEEEEAFKLRLCSLQRSEHFTDQSEPVQHCTPRAYQTKPSHVFQCVISLNSKRLNSVIATLEGILMCRNCREALHWSTPCKVMSGGSRGMQGWNLDCKIYVGGLHEEANK